MTSEFLQRHTDITDQQQKRYLCLLRTRRTAMSLGGMVKVDISSCGTQ